MFNLNENQSKYFLRNSVAIPFFYKKFYWLLKPLSNIFHFVILGRIASGILHDISNPLTALLLSLSIKDIAKNEIEKSSEELSNLIRIVQYQLKNNHEKEIFKVSEIVNDCFLLIKHKAISNSIRLIKIVHDDIEICGSKISLMRIIINLLTNAIESYENVFKNQKDVIVSIFEKNTYLHIYVQDFGCGISEKDKKKVFKYFYTNKNNGTGIGLYISQKNIKMKYSGKIEVESKLNEGSIFKIKIPLKTSF